MEFCPDLQDWELILGSELSDNNKSVELLDEEAGDGAIKADYFSLDSVGRSHPPPEEESNEAGNDSDNPSWVDPDSDSRFLETSRGKLDCDGMRFSIRNSDGFWSDESSDGQRSLPDREAGELENLGGSFMVSASEGTDVKSEIVEKESEGSEDSGTLPMECVDGGDDSVKEGEKREKFLWKMPFELLKFCIFRVRPIWSISIAAAVLGIAMLGRKLYRMKHKSRSIPLRIAMDDKKASEFAARSARLNAISLVRRMPIIRPSLPASGTTQWAALPLR